MKHLFCFAAIAMSLAATPSFAIDPDEVRGEVIEVSADKRELVIRVLDAGENRDARAGQTETYYVPAGTDVDFDIDQTIYRLGSSGGNELSDISTGDTVVLHFTKTNDRLQATRMRTENPKNTVLRKRVIKQGAVVFRRPAINPDPAIYGSNATGPGNGSMTRDSSSDQAPTQMARNRLPDSASFLPLIGLLGFGFAGTAGWLHRNRTRK
ncbi:MAG: hypothetical protein R3E77_06715 [Steroidobacteraceae bacterium]